MSGVRASQPVQALGRAFNKLLIYDKKSEMIDYIKDSFEELKNNVSWPSWTQGYSLTVLVALFSVIFSLAIWGVDSVFAAVVEAYFKMIK